MGKDGKTNKYDFSKVKHHLKIKILLLIVPFLCTQKPLWAIKLIGTIIMISFRTRTTRIVN